MEIIAVLIDIEIKKMPLINNSSYKKAPWYLLGGQLQSLIPGGFRKVEEVVYKRERLELPDDDFVDLDWVENDSKKLIILSHGLEGNSDRQYMRGAARFFSQKNWDVLAWNCRSCSGEMNRQLRLYNHGEIEDIDQVIRHAMKKNNYEQIVLSGYSMGGSIVLKYLGVHGDKLPAPITHGIAFSSPTDLRESIRVLEDFSNRFYKWLFRRRLERKIRKKATLFPNKIDISLFSKVRKWEDFDNFFSAPINGFKNVKEFYQQASAKFFMPEIKIPALLVNAYNDPIIPTTCSPIEMAKHHKYFHLEMPPQGGHVGFTLANDDMYSWMEYRVWEFINGDK